MAIDLRERIHNLPPEIFNEIKTLVFTSTPSRVTIDADYKPPPQLHVSYAIRQRYAEAFYRETVFEFQQPSLFYKWLKSLDARYTSVAYATELQVQMPQTLYGFAGKADLLRFVKSYEWKRYSEFVCYRIRKDIAFMFNMPNMRQPRMKLVSSDSAATPLCWSNGTIDIRGINGRFRECSNASRWHTYWSRNGK